MVSASVHPKERRRDTTRRNAALPFNFSSFNHSRLHRKHHGLICNQSMAGACFQTSQRCIPGTIVFMQKHRAGASKQRAHATRLAEIRWCTPAKEREGAEGKKWSIGIRYL